MTVLRKNSSKSKLVYTSYGIGFDGAGLWSFSNDFVKNVVIFVVDSSSPCHADNCQNNF